MAATVKSVIEVRPEVWRAFKALAAERGESVQAALGRLVAGEVSRTQTAKARALGRRKAAQTAMQKALAEIDRGDVVEKLGRGGRAAQSASDAGR